MSRSDLVKQLRQFDDPALWTRCEDVQPGDDLSFLRTMRKVCQACPNGVGLAAPQIGVLKRAVFIWPGRAGYGRFLINPIVTAKSDRSVLHREECLSFPRVAVDIVRAESVDVTFLDERLRPQGGRFAFFDAVVLQHELEHLDGACRVGLEWRRRSAKTATLAAPLAQVTPAA